MGGSIRSKLVFWIFGAVLLAVTGTAHAAAEIRIEPTTLYFGAAAPSVRASVGAPEVWEGLPAPGIRPEVLESLREKAAEQREVRVLVRLAVPFTPEGRRGSEAVQEQRLAIDRAQDAVLGKLKGERAKLQARFEYIPFLALEVDAKALDRLASLAEVHGIEEDVLDSPALASSTVVIGANVAWASGWTGAGKVVAVLDTGVDKNHPFFSSGAENKVVSEACYSSNGVSLSIYYTSICPGRVKESTAPGSGVPCVQTYGQPSGECDHGTRVAGVAAGDDGTGPGFGVARGADIISVQVFSQCARGFCLKSWASDQIKGLERVYALAGQFDIAAVNLSVAGGSVYTSRAACDADNVARKAAIDNLRSIDIPTIAASGNGGSQSGTAAPGCISSAISVGATSDGDRIPYWSNIAPYLDLMAPGLRIESPVPGGGTQNAEGTSLAAAHVTGAWAVLRQANPTATVPGLLGVLRETAVPVSEIIPPPPPPELTPSESQAELVDYDLRRINLGRAIGAPLEPETFTVYNDGSSVLAVQSIQLQTPMSWIRWSPQAPFDVPPGGSKTVKVSVDFGGAPAGPSMNRLLVISNDADESPYPGGVFLAIDKQPCYLLTRIRTGRGSNPVPGLASSPGCPAGQYHAGQVIPLSAVPGTGSVFVSWSGTDNDGSTAPTNSLRMPAAPHTVSAEYRPLCYPLTYHHTGSGADPVPSPASSPGCPAGQYHFGDRIEVTAAPARYWRVGSWTNTRDDDLWWTLTNSVEMPAHGMTVTVNYQQGLPGVLVVNDSYGYDYIINSYTEAVQASGRVFDVWNSGLYGPPDLSMLAAYPRVIWVLGFLRSDVFQLLSAYLDGGGSLFLSARLGTEPSPFSPFLQSYLGGGYFDRYYYYYSVTGQGPVFGSLGTYNPMHDFGYGDLSPAPDAQVIFRAHSDTFGPGNAAISRVGPGYRTVFLSFSFEHLPTPEAQSAVMSTALDFLGTVFEDVPSGYWGKKWVEALYRNGVTQGCGLMPRLYCPESPVSREQMAVFLLRAQEGSAYTPPPCTGEPFNDVAADSFFCPWIQEIANRGITSGCGNGNFCPSSPVTREQMAFFLLKTLEGPDYTLPACSSETPFPDVAVGSFFCAWIQELAQRGLTTGCGGGNYCPGDPVTRAQIATFLVQTFGLPLY